MALILAIQPDEQQAAILSGVVMNQLRADLVLVDSKDAALARIRSRVPDLILLAAELGRPDDEEFAGKLRKIKNAEHLRTLSMPRLGDSDDDEERPGGGLLSAFKRKRVETRRHGRDPKLFAKELRSYLKRAERIKADRRAELGLPAPAPADTPAPALSVEPDSAPRVAPAPRAEAEPPAAALVTAPAPSAVPEPVRGARSGLLESQPIPRITLDAIEARVTMSMRAIDSADAGASGDADAIIRALRVPPRVAGFAYPRGCRIRHVRLTRLPFRQSPKVMRRAVMEPPPAGGVTRYHAAF